ncbi:MAG TPA: RraA family protein [Thermoanaerobaculia bacterium]
MIDAFPEWTTPLLADGCLRCGLPLRIAPPGIKPVIAGARAWGPARPVRHYGSVDIFLEGIAGSRRGDVLVIDNGGRRDEACVGDLTALEVRLAGLAGMVVWGCHRDGPEIASIELPVFSYGSVASGPRRLDARPGDALERALFGDASVSAGDFVFADADGVVFVPGEFLDRVLEAAESIARTERAQAKAIAGGRSLRSQLKFDEFLRRRKENPGWTLREHLREVGGAIEV